MGLLEGKKGVILGVANKKSIAWAIAEAFHKEGAEFALNFLNDKLADRVVPLGESINCPLVAECDVGDDESIAEFYKKVEEKFGQIDFIVHSVAFADKDELVGEFYNTSRNGFNTALEISAFSLVAVTKPAVHLLKDKGSIISLTYNGSQRVIPNYNVMGVAKAALEATVRYLANDLGPRQIRVNSVSPGPIKTLSSSGINKFKTMLTHVEEHAPMKRNITTGEVATSCVYLASDLSHGVTGTNLFVDCGHQIMGM